jgi:hypothetical protein
VAFTVLLCGGGVVRDNVSVTSRLVVSCFTAITDQRAQPLTLALAWRGNFLQKQLEICCVLTI